MRRWTCCGILIVLSFVVLSASFARGEVLKVVGTDSRLYTVIDNVTGGSGTGDYTEAGMNGHSASGWYGDARYGHSGTSTWATWTFDFSTLGLSNGGYDVYMTWQVSGSFPASTQASVTVSDGGPSLTINPLDGPWAITGGTTLDDGVSSTSYYFAPLGSATVADGNLAVTLTGIDSSFICADAVAITQIPEPGLMVLAIGLLGMIAFSRRIR